VPTGAPFTPGAVPPAEEGSERIDRDVAGYDRQIAREQLAIWHLRLRKPTK
jgi:hypothetical protein